MVPTIGRRMYFFCTPSFREQFMLSTVNESLPFDAGVIYTNAEGTLVNVMVTDHVGMQRSFHHVPVVTESKDHSHNCWVEWMPYQKEQAAKQQEVKSPVELGAMSYSQLQEFRVQLETKTSWGRNELKDLLLQVLSH